MQLRRSHRHIWAEVMALTLAVLTSIGLPSEPSRATAARDVAVRPSPGCATPTVVAGQQTLNFVTKADNGSYIEQIPATADTGRPLPLVFDFHGYEESGPALVKASTLGTYGQSHGFITITPWVNGEPVPMWLSSAGSRDLVWFGQLLTHIEAKSCIDETRVFVTGGSNGAFMTSAIACEYPGRVAAVAPVSGIQAMARCATTRPVPVVTFHGTADPLVPYDGKASKLAADLPAPDGSGHRIEARQERLFGAKGVFQQGPSIPREAAAWARRNGCSSDIDTIAVIRDVTLLSWQCPSDANVELYRITDGGHVLPETMVPPELHTSGRVKSLSMNAIIWQFFEAHPLSRFDQ